MPYRIDNPGGGDCGFYAFAIGLINTIQEEHQLKKKSKTYEQWQKKGLNDVRLQEILNIDLNQLYDAPYRYKKETLLQLQMSLRSVSAHAYKSDLLHRIEIEAALNDGRTTVEGAPVYHKFMELVHFYLRKGDTLDKISQFNELALSPEVLVLAQKTAETLVPKLENQTFEQAQKIENAHVKEALLHDVLTGDKENPRSIILKGLEKIKEQGRWATHSDLKEVATQLNVNLHVTNKLNGEPSPNCPTITLNNESDAHWTTNVEKLPAPKQVKSIEKHVESPKPKEKTQISQEERVIASTVSAQIEENKVERYRQHVKALIQAASTQGLFSKVENKIQDLDNLDMEKAAVDKDGVQIESDEDFARRLQEAEFRRANLK